MAQRIASNTPLFDVALHQLQQGRLRIDHVSGMVCACTLDYFIWYEVVNFCSQRYVRTHVTASTFRF